MEPSLYRFNCLISTAQSGLFLDGRASDYTLSAQKIRDIPIGGYGPSKFQKLPYIYISRSRRPTGTNKLPIGCPPLLASVWAPVFSRCLAHSCNLHSSGPARCLKAWYVVWRPWDRKFRSLLIQVWQSELTFQQRS